MNNKIHDKERILKLVGFNARCIREKRDTLSKKLQKN